MTKSLHTAAAQQHQHQQQPQPTSVPLSAPAQLLSQQTSQQMQQLENNILEFCGTRLDSIHEGVKALANKPEDR